MTHHTDIAARIEKNRLALLRVVSVWLYAASLLRCDIEKPLPRRLRVWIAGLLFKIETAASFLFEGASYLIEPLQRGDNAILHTSNRAHIAFVNAPLTIKAVVERLMALRTKLESLHCAGVIIASARRRKRNLSNLALMGSLFESDRIVRLPFNGHANFRVWPHHIPP